jgi:hypothetical protein
MIVDISTTISATSRKVSQTLICSHSSDGLAIESGEGERKRRGRVVSDEETSSRRARLLDLRVAVAICNGGLGCGKWSINQLIDAILEHGLASAAERREILRTKLE